MSRFVTNATVPIDLGDGEVINVRAKLSFDELEAATNTIDKDGKIGIKASLPLLEVAVVSWNLKDDEGKPVKYSKEQLTKLDTETFLTLVTELSDRYFPKKKDSAPSAE